MANRKASPVFCVCDGMCEWNACPNAFAPPTINSSPLLPSSEPHPSSRRKEPHPTEPPQQANNEPHPSSVSKRPPNSKRFKFSTDREMEELSKGIVPVSTTKATKWAVSTFEQWYTARNTQDELEKVPTDILTSTDPEVLNKYLSLFAVEARKTNGDSYPPATLHQLLCGILRHMRAINSECPNFLDKKDGKFKKLQSTLDSLFHNLHSEGIGKQIKHAEIFTSDNEVKLWESGVVGLSTPTSLQNAVFYTIGKMFCLRGGQEHRSLKLSQLGQKSQIAIYITKTLPKITMAPSNNFVLSQKSFHFMLYLK